MNVSCHRAVGAIFLSWPGFVPAMTNLEPDSI